MTDEPVLCYIKHEPMRPGRSPGKWKVFLKYPLVHRSETDICYLVDTIWAYYDYALARRQFHYLNAWFQPE